MIAETQREPSEELLPAAKWMARHLPHLGRLREFSREPFIHPDGTWVWLICPCGARHLICEAGGQEPAPK